MTEKNTNMELNKIYCESNLETMAKMPDNFVDLIVTSPPYGNLRKYKGFCFDFNSFAKLVYDKMKNGGVLVWVCQDQCIDGGESMVSFEQALFFRKIGFKLYDTMIWRKPSPQAPTEGRYYDVFEYMFIFSKGKPKTIKLLADRQNLSAGMKSKKETRSCKEDRKYTGEHRIVAEFSRRFNVWDISRDSIKTEHPATFPEQLAADHILSWSNEGDLIYDPFMGSGTTAKMAHLLNRKWIGSEISQEYVDIANKRLMPYLCQPTLF